MPISHTTFQINALIRARAFRPLLLLAFLSALLCGCAKPQRTLVVTVGGLGFSQMHELRMAVEKQCPDAKVVSAGAWDAYKTDITKIATAKPRQHIILIGHSFGCEAIDRAAAELPKVDLAVFIDPAWSDFSLAATIQHYLWFKRSSIGIEREARIVGASGPRQIAGGHNDIPHSPELIAQVVAEIQRIDRDQPLATASANTEVAGR
jgi:pimeloyl-ACP methyl ester carboxylesterase